MNATKIPVEILIPALTLGDIESVYSGRDGVCACGCAGTYYEREMNERVKTRGRTINPGMFKKVLRLLQAPGAKIEVGETFIETTVGSRVYRAFLRGAN